MNEIERCEDWSHFEAPPFVMRQETEMEKYRYRTWATKEPETLVWIRSFEPQAVFFDVGANVGLFSLYCASQFPSMSIAAFEPMPANYAALCHNIRLNRFYIDALQWAIGNRNGYVSLEVPDSEAGKSGAQAQPFNKGGGITVMCAKLDSLAESGPLNVKIDIDGQEGAVIEGMKKTLPIVKSILVEVSKATRKAIVDTLTAAGFTMDNRFNKVCPHSRERRAIEGIDAENIIFTR